MPEDFYSSISKYYQHIFPFNPEQITFLRNVLPFNGAKILDVGSAIGDLSFALTHFGFPVWAIDFDLQMIQTAQNIKPENTLFPVFDHLDMRKIGDHYPESFFNSVICFGNTLVHLLTLDDIRNFIQAAFKVLNSEGKLCIQILNYDQILDHEIKSLPIIDNDHIRFERSYSYTSESELIDFNTMLTVHSTGQEISNSVQLNPIRTNKLQEILLEAGFEAIEFFGNFKSESLKENSLPLIITCQKPINGVLKS